MVANNKRVSTYDSYNRKKLKYFSYEEEFYCKNDSEIGQRDIDKVQGIYLLIGGLILIACLCLLGFDLFLQTPRDGISAVDYEQLQRNGQQRRRHNNTPASSLSSTPPVLAPMEYWL